MSAGHDRLEQAALERLAVAIARTAGISDADADAVLAAAEAYAQAVAGRAMPVITLPEPLPVHFQASPCRAACPARGRARRLTRDPGKVTCGECAAILAPPKPWAAALDEFLAAPS